MACGNNTGYGDVTSYIDALNEEHRSRMSEMERNHQQAVDLVRSTGNMNQHTGMLSIEFLSRSAQYFKSYSP